MEERGTGIILRVRPLTETSLIVHWLSREHGRVSTVAKGARRAKSPFLGKLDLFYEAEFTWQRSRRSELHALREVSLRKTHRELRESLPALNAASYFAVLIEQGTERETPLEEFFLLFQSALEGLGNAPIRLATILSFELRYLNLLGVLPEWRGTSLSPAAVKAAELLLADSTAASSVAGRESEELNRFSRLSIGMTLEKLPPQRERTLRSLPPA